MLIVVMLLSLLLCCYTYVAVLLLYTAPSAPLSFEVSSSTPSSLAVQWDRPDPLNGMFGAYQLQYAPEGTFQDTFTERLLFVSRFTINRILGGVVYRLQVRAGTISLTGDILWGPFAALRVRDGKTYVHDDVMM